MVVVYLCTCVLVTIFKLFFNNTTPYHFRWLLNLLSSLLYLQADCSFIFLSPDIEVSKIHMGKLVKVDDLM